MLTRSFVARDPLAEFTREFDRVFGSFGSGAGARRGRVFPAMNVWHDEAHVYVELEVPGFALEDLEVLATPEALTVRGHREAPAEERPGAAHVERFAGSFERVIPLGGEVDVDRIDATARDGVLRVTIAKCERVRPRRIEVRGAGADAPALSE